MAVAQLLMSPNSHMKTETRWQSHKLKDNSHPSTKWQGLSADLKTQLDEDKHRSHKSCVVAGSGKEKAKGNRACLTEYRTGKPQNSPWVLTGRHEEPIPGYPLKWRRVLSSATEAEYKGPW